MIQMLELADENFKGMFKDSKRKMAQKSDQMGNLRKRMKAIIKSKWIF